MSKRLFDTGKGLMKSYSQGWICILQDGMESTIRSNKKMTYYLIADDNLLEGL